MLYCAKMLEVFAVLYHLFFAKNPMKKAFYLAETQSLKIAYNFSYSSTSAHEQKIQLLGFHGVPGS
jgi:hypothetical protein